jgi:riboflavin kinase/FMN adenylyltransferase
MIIHRPLEELPVFRNAIITIGTFDGVHTGHQQIIRQLREEALRANGESLIISFHPHPRKIVGKSGEDIKLINTPEEKIELLSAFGIDHLVIVPFTEAFSQLTAEQYIRDFLFEKFHPHTVIIGYDHRFGKGRLGDYHLLEEGRNLYGYKLKEIPVHLLSEISVSSTRIRESIMLGDVETANQLLGYTYFFNGLVTEGNKLGRTIGFPTANLKIDDWEKILPGQGVYAVDAEFMTDPGKQLSGVKLAGMMNIGKRPTINNDDSQITIEVNLFNFDESIYGRTIRVFVKKYLRAEQKFNGLQELKEQLARDKAAAILVPQSNAPSIEAS